MYSQVRYNDYATVWMLDESWFDIRQSNVFFSLQSIHIGSLWLAQSPGNGRCFLWVKVAEA
jgi:hypothetical protein